MSNKEIKFRAVVETQEFDKQIQQLQQKFKQLQGISPDQGKANSLLSAAFGKYDRASESDRKNMATALEQQHKKEIEFIKQKRDAIKALQNDEKISLKNHQDKIELLKQEVALHGESARTINRAKATVKPIGEEKKDADTLGIAKKIKRALAIASAGMIGSGALNTYEYLASRDRKMLGEQAAVGSVAAQEQAERYAGRGYRLEYFSKERNQALSMAGKEADKQSNMDLISTLLKTTLSGIAGAGMGGPLGAIGAAGLSLTSNERGMARLFDPERYNAMKLQGFSQNYKANLEAQKLLNYEKTQALGYFEQNIGQLGQLERGLGVNLEGGLLGEKRVKYDKEEMPTRQIGKWTRSGVIGAESDSSYNQKVDEVNQRNMQMQIKEDQRNANRTKGYLDLNKEFGATGETDKLTVAAISQQIEAMRAAGASTQGIAGEKKDSTLAGFSARLGQAGVNAGGILGTVQAMGGPDIKAQNEFAKIMKIAFKEGIDISTLPKELERFAQLTTEVATQGGGMSDILMQRVADAIGSGKSAQEMQAGAQAVMKLEERAGTVEGLRGQIGFGFMGGDKAKELLGEEGFDKLQKDFPLKKLLNTLSAGNLEKDDELLSRLETELGIPKEKVLEFMQAKDASKLTLLKSSKEAYASGDPLEMAKAMAIEGEDLKGKFQRDSFSKAMGSYQGFKSSEINAEDPMQKIIEAGKDKKITQVEGQLAGGEGLNLENLKTHMGELNSAMAKFNPQMDAAATAVEKFTEAINKLPEGLKVSKEMTESFANLLQDLKSKGLIGQ